MNTYCSQICNSNILQDVKFISNSQFQVPRPLERDFSSLKGTFPAQAVPNSRQHVVSEQVKYRKHRCEPYLLF